jgi:hypothetical protein
MTTTIHGPRATVIAPPGKIFVDFDADGLHYRIAGCLSNDSFINETLTRYDKTGDEAWKPHIQNCCALFGVSTDQAIAWMNAKASQYTFAKNFIYMLLNGGEVGALHDAAVGAKLALNEKEVAILLYRWLDKANRFKVWREGLVKEAEQTGMITLPDGRRRRFYALKWKTSEKKFVVDKKTKKEIFNLPLIGTEVSFMNPRVKLVYDATSEDESNDWVLNLYEHDGFMLEGPEESWQWVVKKCLTLIDTKHIVDKVRTLVVPWDFKVGKCWAELEKRKLG